VSADPTVSVEATLDRLSGTLSPVTLPPPDVALPPRSDEGGSAHRERLELLRRIGRGGMGEIHAARDPLLARDVALKVMLRSKNSRWGHRFAREARVTAQLDHPNIVPVYDADLGGDEGLAYSMKLVTGATLTEVLAASAAARTKGGAVPDDLSLDTLLDHVTKMCDAIAYAHDKGVVHRDLKPDNVMIGAHGEVYVMDWGLARVLGDADVQGLDDAEVTRPGYALGTVRYMAPEQATGQPMEPPCDQYALGLILYEAVAGRSARPRDDDLQKGLERAAAGQLLPLVSADGGAVRRELAAIVAKATHRLPERRYPSVRHLADDLRRYRANQPVHAAPDTLLQGAQRWISRHREAALRLVLLLLLLLVGTVAAFAISALVGVGAYARWAEARQARLTELVTHIGSRAAELEQALSMVDAQVEGMASASQALLLHAQPDPERPVFAPSVFTTDAKPDDTAWSAAYDRPLSTWWPDVVISPGVDRSVVVDQARKLVPARHAMRRAHLEPRKALDDLSEAAAERSWRDEPGPTRWAILATPEGLYLEMPGAAWDATNYDGRVRPWYTLATEPRPRWGEPYQESSSGTLLVACSMQIPGEDGADPLGVASLSVSFTWLVDRFLSVDHPAVEETYIVTDDARIIFRSSQQDATERPDDLSVTYATPAFPDPVLQPALSDEAGLVQASDGDLLLHHPLDNGWWYVARVDPTEAVAAR
jgi:serine/threonine-protein kinase